MSRWYLGALSDDVLTRMIEETIRSVNHIMVTLIIDRVSGSGYRRVGIGDMAEQQSRLLQDARRYIELTGIGYEIAILRRIADDAMDILSQRREEVDNE